MKIRILHKDIYTTSHKLSKRDKLGIHKNIEDESLKLFSLVIEAAFTAKYSKLKTLELARISGEILKQLIRTEQELEIIDVRTYLRISNEMIEISKMLNGWISYINGDLKK